ncbi:MAG: type II toxin-antitoxin system VapC family toxin, partial [Parasphingopyxis sp.]
MYLLDTNVVIRMRDGDSDLLERLRAVPDMLAISVVTAIELEGGLHFDREDLGIRRKRLHIVMEGIAVLPFEDEAVAAYR